MCALYVVSRIIELTEWQCTCVGLLYRTIWLGGLMFWATFVSHCVGRFYFRPLHPSAWAKAKIVNCVIQHEEMLNQKKKKNTRRCRHLYYNRASATHGSIKEKTTLLVPTSLQLQELLGSCCLPWLTTNRLDSFWDCFRAFRNSVEFEHRVFFFFTLHR